VYQVYLVRLYYSQFVDNHHQIGNQTTHPIANGYEHTRDILVVRAPVVMRLQTTLYEYYPRPLLIHHE